MSPVSARRPSLLELRLVGFVRLTQQDGSEGGAEGLVAERVTHGVDGAVDVAQPVSQSPQRLRDALVTERVHQDHDVVRRPGDDEGQEDGAQRLRRFILFHQRDLLALVGEAFGVGLIFGCFGVRSLSGQFRVLVEVLGDRVHGFAVFLLLIIRLVDGFVIIPAIAARAVRLAAVTLPSFPSQRPEPKTARASLVELVASRIPHTVKN